MRPCLSVSAASICEYTPRRLQSIDERQFYSKEPEANPPSLEDFVREHDRRVFCHENETSPRLHEQDASPLYGPRSQIHLHIVNAFEDVQAFHRYLESLDILNPDRLRPRWDTYFMVSI